MNDLSGRHSHQYKKWRRAKGDCNKVTMATQLSTLKVFIDFCESIDAVQPGLSDYIDPTTMKNKDDVNDDYVDTDTAQAIIEYQRNFNYSQREHVIFELLWHTGMRNGALRAIDPDDYEVDATRTKRRQSMQRTPRGHEYLQHPDYVLSPQTGWSSTW